jgi:predicted RNA-binding protein with PUA-like domain
LLATIGIMSKTQYWLVKSEPETYGIRHLKKDKRTAWTGVRNYLARNFMRQMHKGDGVLFYHSSCAVPGVYGIAEVAEEAAPDDTQFDASGEYYEPRATREKPVWECATIRFVEEFSKPVTLEQIRADKMLAHMTLLARGNRLSVMPVTKAEFDRLVALGGAE